MSFLIRNLGNLQAQRCLCVTQRLVATASAARSASVKDDKKEIIKESATESKQQILVSDSCIKRLREICKDGSFLRVLVEGGGCSGFQYKFDLDNKLNEDDQQFGKEDARVVIDSVSLEYCNGATVDYHKELIRAGFRILANPKAEQGCSCGASFAIKLD